MAAYGQKRTFAG